MLRLRQTPILASCLAWGALLAHSASSPATEPKAAVPLLQYQPPRVVGTLQHAEIIESSGIAISRRRDHVFWTHNDSGDKARLFAFDRQGKHLGAITTSGTDNVDWEDLASFDIDGRHYLLVGDTGDNQQKRESYQLYLFEEPELDQRKAQLIRKIPFRYADGPHDCESLAVDPAGPHVYLVTKEMLEPATIFRLTLPDQAPTEPVVARPVARHRMPLATGMDLAADGRRAIVVTYLQAYEFTRGAREDWEKAFARAPRVLQMPERRQGEAIGYGADSRTLYLTTEGERSPLWEIAPLRK